MRPGHFTQDTVRQGVHTRQGMLLPSLSCADQRLSVHIIIALQYYCKAGPDNCCTRPMPLACCVKPFQSVDGVLQGAWLPGTTLLQRSHLMCCASTQLSSCGAKCLQLILRWQQASAGHCSAPHRGPGDAAVRPRRCCSNLMVTQQQLPSSSSAAQGELPAPAGPAGSYQSSTLQVHAPSLQVHSTSTC